MVLVHSWILFAVVAQVTNFSRFLAFHLDHPVIDIVPPRNKRSDGKYIHLRGDTQTLQRGSLHNDSTASRKISRKCVSRYLDEKYG